MNIKNKIFLLLLAVFISIGCFSQTDTLLISNKPHSPKRAAIYSAILPGSGQAYNKKYWKMPIVYAGLGALAYFIIDNHSVYSEYKQEYIHRYNGAAPNKFQELYSDQILNEMERWSRYRDLCIAGAAIFYVLQIVDANVDAHLFDFDVGDNLTVRISPKQFNNNFGASPAMGVGFTIRFH